MVFTSSLLPLQIYFSLISFDVHLSATIALPSPPVTVNHGSKSFEIYRYVDISCLPVC